MKTIVMIGLATCFALVSCTATESHKSATSSTSNAATADTQTPASTAAATTDVASDTSMSAFNKTVVAEFGANLTADQSLALADDSATKLNEQQIKDLVEAVHAQIKALKLNTIDDLMQTLPQISAAATVKAGEMDMKIELKSKAVGQIVKASAKLLKGRHDKLVALASEEGLTPVQTVLKNHIDLIIAALDGAGFAKIDMPSTLKLIMTNSVGVLKDCDVSADEIKDVSGVIVKRAVARAAMLAKVTPENAKDAIQAITGGVIAGLGSINLDGFDATKLKDATSNVVADAATAISSGNFEGMSAADLQTLRGAVSEAVVSGVDWLQKNSNVIKTSALPTDMQALLQEMQQSIKNAPTVEEASAPASATPDDPANQPQPTAKKWYKPLMKGVPVPGK